MPHCVLWSDADWQFAHDTGGVHAVFANGGVRQAGELRLREMAMGTTWQARRQLRIRYLSGGEVAASDDPEVASLTDYRQLLDG
jgi:hypothetical protein